MKSLYNEYEAETKEADDITKKIDKSLKHIISFSLRKGYSLREVHSIVLNHINVKFSEEILRKACKMKREKRERIS